MKKGEILFFSTNSQNISDKIQVLGFPSKVLINTINNGNLLTFTIRNLPSNFNPYLITFYGKDLDCLVSQRFNVNFHSFNNSLNKTNLVTESDGTKTIVISDTTLTNFGLKSISRNICTNQQLVAKIVIVYTDC